MSDLIERDAVMLRVREFIGNPSYDELMLVNDLNALSSVESKQWAENAHWIKKPYLLGTSYFCSVCGNNYGMAPHAMYKFCPNCGARMGDNDDN